MVKNLAFIIKTSQDFVRTNEENPLECDKLMLNSFFEAISDSYIPLLQMFERLKNDGVSFKLGLVLPPVLCSMLEDEKIQKLYVDFLDKRIALGKKELTRCKDNQKALEIITATCEKNKELKKLFNDTYEKKLVPQFAKYQREGLIEILGTCATDIFMPYYSDLPEALSAQIEMGLQSYKKCFGELPDGFYLPELGYTPGIEKIIRSYGYTYTILHSRSVLLTDNPPANGIFFPVRTDNSLAVYTADPYIEDDIYSEEDGWCANSVYRNENRDIGFELEFKKLTPVMEEKAARCSTGYKYWQKDFNDDAEVSYSAEAAAKQAEEDAADFIQKRVELLSKAGEYVQNAEYVVSVCCIDEYKIRKHWSEYLIWLENVLRKSAEAGLAAVTCKEILQKPSSLERIDPYYSAGTGEGYGENLLSSRNCWMMRYVRKATERMIDLAGRFPSDTGLKTRLLNIGALELLLAQSSSLAKMIDEGEDAEYSERRFRLAINAFTVVFDALGSNTVSTEWLTKLELMDNIFPWINYKIFSVKK